MISCDSTEFDVLEEIFCKFLNFNDTEKCLTNLEMGDKSDINDIMRFDGIWHLHKIFVTYQPDNCDWLNIWSLYRLLSGADILDLINLINLIEISFDITD